jgi:diguanylate cyclase (GGDEF)-like protein
MKTEELKHFDLLKELGVWDELEQLRKELKESEKFTSEVLEMYSRNSPESLINFVISNFLDRFVPSTLLFLIEDPLSSTLSPYFFRNLKPSVVFTGIDWYFSIKNILSPYRGPIQFPQIEAQIPLPIKTILKEHYAPEVLYPIRGIGGVYGIILFGSKVVPGPYLPQERKYIEKVMLFFSVALQNILHHYSSITDSKTGLYNHAYFLKRLEEELGKHRRRGKGLGIILMDIDHFKLFNDTYGHLAGDVVLIELGRILKNLVRSEDVLARFGGEEFILLISDCKLRTLISIAERIRTTIERIPILYEGQELHVTISLGCSYLHPGIDATPRSLITQSDTALYRSKQEGRNRTSLYKGGLLYRGLLHRSLKESPHQSL